MKILPLRRTGLVLFCLIAGNMYGGSSSWTKSISIPYATPETNPPVISIQYPTNNQRVGQSVIQTVISATDDTRVESLLFAVNGTSGNWSWAPGMQWPWGASITLNPGSNTFEVLCADYWGNTSSASVTFVYVPDTALVLDIENGGNVVPNYQGQTLNMGQNYSMTAHPAKGFRFEGWSGSLVSAKPKLTFGMQPNLSFTARFKDIKRPLNVVTFRRTSRAATKTTPHSHRQAHRQQLRNQCVLSAQRQRLGIRDYDECMEELGNVRSLARAGA